MQEGGPEALAQQGPPSHGCPAPSTVARLHRTDYGWGVGWLSSPPPLVPLTHPHQALGICWDCD